MDRNITPMTQAKQFVDYGTALSRLKSEDRARKPLEAKCKNLFSENVTAACERVTGRLDLSGKDELIKRYPLLHRCHTCLKLEEENPFKFKIDPAGREIDNQIIYERIIETPIPNPSNKKKLKFLKETTTFTFDRNSKISHIEQTIEKIKHRSK